MERCDRTTIELVGRIIKERYNVETGMTEHEDHFTDLILYTTAGTKNIEVKSKNQNYYYSWKFPISPEQFGDGNIIVLNADSDGGECKWDKILNGKYQGFIVYDKPTKTLYLFSIPDLLKADMGKCKMLQNHNTDKTMWEQGGYKRRWETKEIINLNKATKKIGLYD